MSETRTIAVTVGYINGHTKYVYGYLYLNLNISLEPKCRWINVYPVEEKMYVAEGLNAYSLENR